MKVLVWNVEKFTNAKFENGWVYRGHFARRRLLYTAAELLAYMSQIMRGNGQAANVPDVIAILEVLAPPADDLGEPLAQHSGGANGLLELLDFIKLWTGNNNWRLVPPLKCNPARPAGVAWAQSEVVGVFYDMNTVVFRGPNEWIANASQAPGTGPTVAYPNPWNDLAVTNQTRLAGQVRFYNANGVELTFPGVGNRRPFVVDFQEVGGAQRTIRFGFIHTSPGFHAAGTREFGRVLEMRAGGAAAPAISVYGGDFNVNDYDVQATREAFAPLQRQRFRKMFNAAHQRSTHYRALADSRPDTVFDYQQHMLIDNFLVRHKLRAGAGRAAYTRAAVNAAEGWPAPYTTTMFITLANLLTYANPTQAFRYWENFWHIRKTSDHTPTFLDIQ